MKGPLSGVKVLELSTFVAAPVCARLLADMGADVIKVEAPNGDTWRQTSIGYRPSYFTDEENPVFDIYNAGKKLVSLNLKTKEGLEAFHKLLSQSDVFVTNIRVQSLKKLGLTYDDLKEKYPSLIYASVLGYGEKGPDADKPAFDTTAYWARSGFLRDMAIDGEHYTPVVPPFSVGDTLTGMFLMGEVCAALYRRVETGKGDYVRSCLYHNAIFSMGTMQIISQKPFGQIFPRDRASQGAPGGYYKCKDGEWVYLAGYARHMIVSFCEKINRKDLINDSKYNTPEACWDNRYEYYKEFENIFLSKTCEEWLEFAEENDFPLIRMNHFSDLPEDEQAWANGFLEHVKFANGNTEVMPRSPIEMDSVGELQTVPASKIGSDTEEVLNQLGYTPEQIKEMLESGAAKS